MEIKNNILKNYLDEIENETITLQKIDKFGQEIELEGLSEMFDLIENGHLGLHALKLYTIVYDTKTIAELASEKTLNFVDMIFAAMWDEEIKGTNSQDISDATLGFVLFGSDVTKRLRNGYRQLNYDSKEFESQIKDLVSFYNDKIKNGTFVKTLSQSQEELVDSEILSLDSSDLESIKIIKRRIEFASLAYEYEDTVDVAKGHEILIKASEMNERELDYVFLPLHTLNIFNEIRTTNALKEADIEYAKKIEPSFSSTNDLIDIDDRMMTTDDEIYDLDVIQDKTFDDNEFVKKIKTFFASKDKKRNKGVNMQNLSVGSTREKKSSSLKYTIIMIFVIAIVGVFFAANTKKDSINEDTTIAERVVEAQVETEKSEKFEIKRTGTNKVD